MRLETLMDHEDTGCEWNLRKTGSNTTFYVGEQFFRRFYTIFDNDNSRMGFGIYRYGEKNATDDDDYETDVWILNAPVDETTSSGMSTATKLMIAGASTISAVAVGVVAFLVLKGVFAAKSAVNARNAGKAKSAEKAPEASKGNDDMRLSINDAPADKEALLVRE